MIWMVPLCAIAHQVSSLGNGCSNLTTMQYLIFCLKYVIMQFPIAEHIYSWLAIQ